MHREKLRTHASVTGAGLGTNWAPLITFSAWQTLPIYWSRRRTRTSGTGRLSPRRHGRPGCLGAEQSLLARRAGPLKSPPQFLLLAG